MKYLITARKWRPRHFNEVVGQTHVTKTLCNALLKRRFAQSYLFSGPRGVGKTTMARIYAKALNCVHGPTENPCGTCDFCKEISIGNSMHYREIDGASHRGIDQIRSLNESLQYASPQHKYRVFVIDEVHMLTLEAFNALLKSLEEPPPKILFIFCTTESYKVPLTIRSRCQHYAFRSFSLDVIQEQLQVILKAEKIEYEKQSLFHIASAANGSMRDAQNLLDQVIAYSEDYLSVKNTLEVLGKTDFSHQKDFIQGLLKKDMLSTKKIVTSLLLEGKSLHFFLYELLHLFSTMVYLKEGVEDLNLLGVNPEEGLFLKEAATSFKQEDLFLINDLIFEFIKELKTTANESVLLQFFLIRLHRYESLITAEALKADLLHLSSHLQKQEEDTAPSLTQERYDKLIVDAVKNDANFKSIASTVRYQKVEAGTLFLLSTDTNLTSDQEVFCKRSVFSLLKEAGYDTIKSVVVKGEATMKDSVEVAVEVFKGSVVEE